MKRSDGIPVPKRSVNGFRVLLGPAIALAALLAPLRPALAGGDWNDAGIQWRSYEDGLKEAKAQAKPVCLVFYTEWCPHCSNYSRVFADPKVVETSKRFVMIRTDRDKNKELSQQFAPDGEYIPRTYFLSRDGKLDPEIHAPRDKYLYFYDESAPDSILAGMDAALKKLSTAESKDAKPGSSDARPEAKDPKAGTKDAKPGAKGAKPDSDAVKPGGKDSKPEAKNPKPDSK